MRLRDGSFQLDLSSVGNVISATGSGVTMLNVTGKAKFTSDVPLRADGIASQSGNLFEARTSTPTTVFSIGPTGLVTLVAGTSSLVPLRFTSGPVHATPQSGAREWDGDAFYATPDGSAVGGRAIDVTAHYRMLDADRTLVNDTSGQSIFGAGITLAGSTTYEFEMVIAVACSGTTTAIKRMLFAGTATITSISYLAHYTHSATSVATAATTGAVWHATATNSNLGATSTTNYSRYLIKGIVRINASGTFSPSLSWSAAPGAAPVVQARSYAKFTPIGINTGTISVGAWA
jgi:hypothetical protein